MLASLGAVSAELCVQPHNFRLPVDSQQISHLSHLRGVSLHGMVAQSHKKEEEGKQISLKQATQDLAITGAHKRMHAEHMPSSSRLNVVQHARVCLQPANSAECTPALWTCDLCPEGFLESLQMH